jgi:hypothetical protein
VHDHLTQAATVRNSRSTETGSLFGFSITEAVVNLYFKSDSSTRLVGAADALAHATAPCSSTTLPPSAGNEREQNSAH